MEYMPTKNGTRKADEIARLLKAGTPAIDIPRIVGCSKDYVRCIRSDPHRNSANRYRLSPEGQEQARSYDAKRRAARTARNQGAST